MNSNGAKNFYIYLANALLVIFASSLIVDRALSATKKEKISIYVGAYDCETSLMSNYLESKKPDNIKEIEINFYSLNDEYYKYYLNLQMRTADIIIVPETDLTRINYEYFIDFSSELVNKYQIPSNNNYYQYNNLDYGYCMFNKNTNYALLDEYISYSSSSVTEQNNYYLFINANSIHVGNYNDDSVDDAALNIIGSMVND